MRHHAIRLESTPLTPDDPGRAGLRADRDRPSAYDYEHILEHVALLVDARGATRRYGLRGDAKVIMA